MARQPVWGVDLDTVEWKPIEAVLPKSEDLQVVSGAMVAVLSEDPETGATTALYRLPGGWQTAAPESHSALQEEFVIEGDLKIGDVEMKAGTYLCLPPGTVHGPGSSRNGCLALSIFDGPFDIKYHS